MRWLSLFLLCGCAEHMTHVRSGWRNCRADPPAIVCSGTLVAVVECLAPRGDACGALAVHYAGGEQVFLHKPRGFDPAHPSFIGGGAVQPEISSDGGLIWFRDGDIRGDEWHVYDPQTGVVQLRDAMGVSLLRDNGSKPLSGGSSR